LIIGLAENVVRLTVHSQRDAHVAIHRETWLIDNRASMQNLESGVVLKTLRTVQRSVGLWGRKKALKSRRTCAQTGMWLIVVGVKCYASEKVAEKSLKGCWKVARGGSTAFLPVPGGLGPSRTTLLAVMPERDGSTGEVVQGVEKCLEKVQRGPQRLIQNGGRASGWPKWL
jgi:hypothetical protein